MNKRADSLSSRSSARRVKKRPQTSAICLPILKTNKIPKLPDSLNPELQSSRKSTARTIYSISRTPATSANQQIIKSLRKRETPVEMFLKTARHHEINVPVTEKSKQRYQQLIYQEAPDYVQKYIKQFIFDKTANACAFKIQTLWRCYIERKNWKGVFNHRVWTRGEVLKRIFVAWRGASSKEFIIMRDSHETFSRLYHEKPWLSMRDTIAPFNLYYISGRYFYPKLFNARTFQQIIRLFARPSGRHIIQLWHSIAHSRACMREASWHFRFTIQKKYKFGFIFVAFHLWHRYSRWTRLQVSAETHYHLKVNETHIIEWNVREYFLNRTKAMKQRAKLQCQKRIIKKAHNALYQSYLDKKQELADLDSSYQFYLKHIQQKSAKAWTTYIENENKRKEKTRLLFRVWYNLIYRSVKRKKYFGLVDDHQKRVLLYKVISNWKVAARKEKLVSLKRSFLLQKKTTIPYFIIFTLLNQPGYAYFIKIWREWIAFTKRRHIWKYFCSAYQNFDAESDFKQKMFYALQRAAQQRLIRRFVHNKLKFLPYHATYSFDGMMKWVAINRKKMKEKRFFLTELDTKNNCFNEEILARSLLLTMSFIKNIEPMTFHEMNGLYLETDQIFVSRSFEELVDLSEKNRKELRKQLLVKLKRDASMLSVITSHCCALEFHEMFAGFSVALNELVICSLKGVEKYEAKLKFFMQIDAAINELAENNVCSQEVPTRYQERLLETINIFHKQFREPLSLNSDDNPENDNMNPYSNQTNISPKASTVFAYKTPTLKIDNFPIDTPILSATRTLKKIHEKQKETYLPIERNTTISKFGVESHMAEWMTMSLHKMLIGLQRFFFSMNGIRVDISQPLVYKRGTTCLDVFPKERQHKLRRNILSFIADMCHIDASEGIPLNIDAPQYVYDVISATLTFFVGLAKTKLKVYQELIPFSDYLCVDSPQLLLVRSRVMMTVYEKFPRLAKDSRKRFRTSLLMMDLDNPEVNEELTNSDAHFASFLLPFIFIPYSVFDYLKTEISVEQRIQGMLEESSSQFFNLSGSSILEQLH